MKEAHAASLPRRRKIQEWVAKYWLALFTVFVAVGFGILENSFFKMSNLLNILSSACLIGITGIGITCIMATGEIDFAAGMELSTGAVGMVVVIEVLNIRNYFAAFLITMLLLALFGCFNAFLHIKIGIPAFIATMGSSYLVRGLLRGVTNGKAIYGSKAWPAAFTFLGQSYLFGFIPMPMVVLLVVGTGMLIYTELTRSGKYIYAVGVNPTACRYLGIDAARQKLKGFLLCALLCGLAGIVQGSMINGANATLGETTLLTALTVLMLGATFIKRGVFNVPGTIVAAILMSVLTNGLTMAGAPAFLKDLVQGGILLAAVSVVAAMRQQAGRA